MMKKEVFFKGEKESFTCRDILESREQFLSSNLRDGEISLELFSLGKIFPEDPKVFCPTFFARERFVEGSLSFSSNFDKELRAREIKTAKEDQLSHLAGLTRSYRDKIEQAIILRESDAKNAGVSLFFAKSTEDLRFEASDLATNCVDLSAEGHKKVFENLNSFLKQHQSVF
jgi:ribosomal protein L20A (L18A)